MNDIDQLRSDIKLARQWAMNHFRQRENRDNNDIIVNLIQNDVEFPEPDEMIIYPKSLGIRIGIPFRYKLS